MERAIVCQLRAVGRVLARRASRVTRGRAGGPRVAEALIRVLDDEASRRSVEVLGVCNKASTLVITTVIDLDAVEAGGNQHRCVAGIGSMREAGVRLERILIHTYAVEHVHVHQHAVPVPVRQQALQAG